MVNYGTTTSLGTIVSDSLMVTSHSVILSGLSPGTAYYFEVKSTDTSGNTVVNNNAGLYYTFTTASTSGGTETQTWTGTMSFRGQADYYSIDITATGTITIDLTWRPLPLNKLDIYLIDPGGSLVEAAYGSLGNAHLENTAAMTGTWTIMVYANLLLITPENYTLTATYPVGGI